MPTIAKPAPEYIASLKLISCKDPLVGSYYYDAENNKKWRTANQLSAVTQFPKAKISNIILRKSEFKHVSADSISGVLPGVPGGFAYTFHPDSTYDLFMAYAAQYDELHRSESYLRAIEKSKLGRERAKAKVREATAAAAAARTPVLLESRITQIDLEGTLIPGYTCGKALYVAFEQIADLLDVGNDLVISVVKELTSDPCNVQTYDEYDDEHYRVFLFKLTQGVFKFFHDTGNQKALRYM